MFQRKGYVKVALDNTEDVAFRVERLLEVALGSTAEDFERLSTADNVTEIEVCPICQVPFCHYTDRDSL